jgi:hypothetical protein
MHTTQSSHICAHTYAWKEEDGEGLATARPRGSKAPSSELRAGCRARCIRRPLKWPAVAPLSIWDASMAKAGPAFYEQRGAAAGGCKRRAGTVARLTATLGEREGPPLGLPLCSGTKLNRLGPSPACLREQIVQLLVCKVDAQQLLSNISKPKMLAPLARFLFRLLS